MSPRPICDTPGCGNEIPPGGEGHPEICPACLRREREERAARRPVEKKQPATGAGPLFITDAEMQEAAVLMPKLRAALVRPGLNGNHAIAGMLRSIKADGERAALAKARDMVQAAWSDVIGYRDAAQILDNLIGDLNDMALNGKKGGEGDG